jgi:hypothetical protein
MEREEISVEILQLEDMVWLVDGGIVGPADIARDGQSKHAKHTR